MHAVVPYTPASVGVVRRRVVAELESRSVPGGVVDDAALLISELVGNAVRHGRAMPVDCLHVSCDVSAGRVRLAVHDGGGGPTRAAAGCVVVPEAEGGRGLFLVEALAGAWGVLPADRGCAVWVELPLCGTRGRRLS